MFRVSFFLLSFFLFSSPLSSYGGNFSHSSNRASRMIDDLEIARIWRKFISPLMNLNQDDARERDSRDSVRQCRLILARQFTLRRKQMRRNLAISV